MIEKSVAVTLDICNRAWREGIVTLPDLTTGSVRVGDSVLYDYVLQEIIRVDSQVTSCQGTQVRLGSQMVYISSTLTVPVLIVSRRVYNIEGYNIVP